MSDDQSAPVQVEDPSLPLTKVIASLKKAGVKSNCELCGVNGWNFSVAYDGKNPVVIAIDDTSGVLGGVTLKKIIAVCDNCGNIRSFARYAVEKIAATLDEETPNG